MESSVFSLSSSQGLNSGSYDSIRVSPLTLFTILDHHTRRPEEYTNSGVVGVLLGIVPQAEVWQSSSSSHSMPHRLPIVEENRNILIKNAFPLVHSTPDQKSLDMNIEFQNVMMDLHSRVNDRELLVGWYTTAVSHDEEAGSISLPPILLQLYEAYADIVPNPIFLVVDATLQKPRLNIRAYQSLCSKFSDVSRCILLLPVTLEIRQSQSETVGLQRIRQAKNQGEGGAILTLEFEQLEQAILSIQNMLEEVSTFVQQVIQGEYPADPNIGRQLMEALSCLSHIDVNSFESMLYSRLQDIFSLIQLSNLSKTQMFLAEKLQSLP